ncbi:F-box only protein 47 [Poecilia latipinna]|uniref:F-box protein 47 n=2 Tax=Poecilia TaxID=8080 RepID=A0A3B3U831_9TELE|nr:PREDICTED: F-box only protein 47 [Poecilia mexicana]XP_014823181.1 PREDICTED: F-box only protein 47 [Poecilia mexicana]XP_014873000.1 PREDICTED: F-box only protein 47 [Poecilia latipinna]XP_014873001.1 PREDICTED: F-box only protein 47 [Poecilia latipinna]XP_016529385.1 PREDICTED: F-box only protein 47 [Poecilia formosa]XP_016529386.1 PREDICTED: F-box only protein 47 [Poecilia formosa]
MIKVRKTTNNTRKYSWTRKSHHLKTPQRPRPVRTVMTRSQCTSAAGFFNGLPAEVFHMILDQMSVVDISVFSMVSKELTSCIVNYISSQAWRNKTIIQSFHNPTLLEQRSTLEHYRHLGLLFKRCTLLLPTKDRLKFIFSKFSQIPCFTLEQCLAPDCTGFSRYGVFLQTLIAGWDELECHRVFGFLCEQTNLLLKTEALLTTKPGLKRYQELQLRLFCRKVLLDPCQNQPDGQFWLVQLLKPWPLVSQAHLLFILFGPLLHEGVLGWEDLVDRGLPHSALWDLAKCILMLSGTLQVKGWSTDSVLSILEELIVIPQPWYLENVARLLVLCGSSLCYTFLASKALNGRLDEISRIIIHIILVCEKDGYHMSWAVKLVQQICKVFSSAPERFTFIQHLENMFSEVTREFYESSVAGNNFEDRETFQTFCILLDSSARFHTKLLHMFLK